MSSRPPLSIDYSKVTSSAFVIDDAVLRHNLSILKSIREATGCKMFQALKTWSTYPLFEITREYLDGSEASSLNEARLGHDFFNESVHIFAPAYVASEFERILENSSTVIFNSFPQWYTYKGAVMSYTKRTGKEIHCGLRINPEYIGDDEHENLWSPCAPGSRLGIRKSELDAELRKNPQALEGISGFHMHIFFDKDFEDLQKSTRLIEERFGAHLHTLEWLNLGGGQRITDDSYDVEGFTKLIREIQSKYKLTMHFEPGAAICKNAGALVTRVLDIVERDDVPYKIAILDMSFNAHTPDFLLSTDLDMPVLGARVVRDLTLHADNLYQLAGGTCVTGDHLNHFHSFENNLSVGDHVVLLDGIQYNMVQCTMFNGVQHPSILHWKDGIMHTLRTFTYEDYKSRMA